MPITMKNVYNQRNGIISFMSNLKKDIENSDKKGSRDAVTDVYRTVGFFPDPITRNFNETEEEFNVRARMQEDERRKNVRVFKNEFAQAIVDTRNEVAFHLISLNSYKLMIENYNDFKRENPDSKLNAEMATNLDIFKAQMLKNGITSIEIDAAEKNDKKMEEKITNACLKNLKDTYPLLSEKYRVGLAAQSSEKFQNALKDAVSFENYKSFTPQINQNNAELYGIIKNAGFTFARDIQTNYVQMQQEEAKAPYGYEFDDSMHLVEKKPTDFFSRIGYFFGRLSNGGKVATYNEQLNQSLAAFDNEAALNDVAQMKEYTNERQQIIIEELSNRPELSEGEKQFEAETILDARKETEPQEETYWNSLD